LTQLQMERCQKEVSHTNKIESEWQC